VPVIVLCARAVDGNTLSSAAANTQIPKRIFKTVLLYKRRQILPKSDNV